MSEKLEESTHHLLRKENSKQHWNSTQNYLAYLPYETKTLICKTVLEDIGEIPFDLGRKSWPELISFIAPKEQNP